MILRLRKLVLALVVVLMSMSAAAVDIKGKVFDAKTREPLVGATIQLMGTQRMAVTDADGCFAIAGNNVKTPCTLLVKYISYKDRMLEGVHTDGSEVEIAMVPDEQTLGEVTVAAVVRRNTEAAMIEVAKSSQVIVSNISAQEIGKTQDSNAGEVIRRVPGVSLIDDKFVMVRGLSQRYNNVWINGGAAPSSEADSRAFSFDLIPSAQIDNMQIVKTPSPEYPADYTGGFITISTKEIPSANTAEVSLGGNFNDATSFSGFSYNKGSATDFLGFDSGMRGINGGIKGQTNPAGTGWVSIGDNGLNNDWLVRTKHPVADMKIAGSLGRRWKLGDRLLGMIAAMNYSNEYRKYTDMQNNLFDVYDAVKDHSNYLRKAVDDQYNHNVRLGAMLNLTLLSPSGRNKYRLKNIFNQLGNNRYTWREGVNAQSDDERSAEYYYRSRTTYNGQIMGKHTLKNDELDWSASYSYANRSVPDRRRYSVTNEWDKDVFQLIRANDISREWTKLDEHIASAAVNDNHNFAFGTWMPSLKAGLYGEYRTRSYATRNFIYAFHPSQNTLPDDFRSMDVPALLSNSAYYGQDKLYMFDQPSLTDDYEGRNYIGAGYLAATLPVGRLSVYAGLRYEYNKMNLTVNLSDTEHRPFTHTYEYNDLFPSVNANYKFNDRHQLRFSYGKTVNRPEFREVAPSVFYDFDLASDVQGNTSLSPCHVHNLDFRYEYYPSKGEIVSLAVFYKNFDSPIEWTYTVTGGTNLVYSYLNAKSANNYGLELDIRKNLDFIGLGNFSWSFNGALIKSKVTFPEGVKDENRPMQGQSPYLINTGLFYKNESLNLDMALLYNRIGKRIIGVGRTMGSTGGQETLRVPDSYEMPRNVIDLSVSKRFGTNLELKLNVRDLLAETVYYRQFADVHYQNGSHRQVDQVTRSFKPGRNIGFNVVYKF